MASPSVQDSGSEIRITLSGGDAEPGRIPANDVAELLLGAERVLARSAGHALSRELRRTGRWGVAIESAVRLRFVGVESGSFTAVLALPPLSETPLGLNAETLTEGAIRVAAGVATDPKEGTRRDVMAALVNWSDALKIGDRYSSITLTHGITHAPAVTLDRLRTEKLRSAAHIKQVPRENELIGRLVEADFERRTAHLRTADGARVTVRFGEEWDDEIHQALRGQTGIAGEVIYDAKQNRAIGVTLRRLTRGEQLHMGLDPGQRETVPIAELAARSGVTPLTDLSRFNLTGVTDEELDALGAALANAPE